MSRSLPGRQPEAGEGLSVLAAQIEAVLFLASSPVSEAELRGVFEVSGAELARAIEELGEHLKSGHGLVLKAMAGGWVLGTNPHFAEVLSRFRDTAQRGRVRLSRDHRLQPAGHAERGRGAARRLPLRAGHRDAPGPRAHPHRGAQEGQRFPPALQDHAEVPRGLRPGGDRGPAEPGGAGRTGRGAPGRRRTGWGGRREGWR